MTPMMLQYLQIKNEYKDYILLYRLGDFYEMFFDDAKTASSVLELTLTGRDCGEQERAPMCGVPYHSVDGYIEKLVASGYKVAICEQTEDPAQAKGLVKREIVKLITPGTLTQSEMLDDKANNYIASICIDDTGCAVCFSDISTGYMSCASLGCDDDIVNECAAYKPSEVLINVPLSSHPSLHEFLLKRLGCMVNDCFPDGFDPEAASDKVRRQFTHTDISKLDIPAVRCVGAALSYIEKTQLTDISYIDKLNIYSTGQFLQMDQTARRSLELCETMHKGEKRGSLLWVLDHTKTSGGARLLKKWINEPLYNQNEIIKRQRCIGAFCDNYTQSAELGEALRGVLDLGRLCTKIVYGSANPRDMKAIAQTCSKIPTVKEILSSFDCPELSDINDKLDALEDVCELIGKALADEVPFSVREGGFIRAGYNADVDRLRQIMRDGKHWIEETEKAERDVTGIKNLKVAYNRVFGYYIEVSKSNLNQVPDRYTRRQTLANCERYITQELKDLENNILGASDRIVKIEYELFCELREILNNNIGRMMASAEQLSVIDCLLSLSVAASRYGYVCPEVDLSDVVHIKSGRHPVVEHFTSGVSFVDNDTTLDTEHNRMMLITGPNMAGKSTYMRQVALIVIMAQMGSYVPAKEARIGLCDKIFTRVGASDDLASGQSTFMLEMNEVAHILKNATKKSLIIYDEIGRGTSTYDGMSIARATAEYTAEKIGAKTLFATHYHELTELADECAGVVNYNIAAKKYGENITFLRKIVPGGTDDSFGIEVAKLAGVPTQVTRRAKQVLEQTEAKHPKQRKVKEPETRQDLNISFDSVAADEIRERIKNVNMDITTPIDAFNLLCDLKKLV